MRAENDAVLQNAKLETEAYFARKVTPFSYDILIFILLFLEEKNICLIGIFFFFLKIYVQVGNIWCSFRHFIMKALLKLLVINFLFVPSTVVFFSYWLFSIALLCQLWLHHNND